MPMERVVVKNFEMWGRLVKTWATGDDYVHDGNSYPRPTDLAEFKRQVLQANCQMTIPDRLTKLDMVQGDDVTLVVRLPPAQMIVDSEHVLAELGSVAVGSPYPLPTFYRDAWGIQQQVNLSASQLLLFHNERIGEYTINNCM